MHRAEHLEVEHLEDRVMLSTVQIYAAGGSGQEALNLLVDNQVVAQFSNIGGDASAREYVELEFETAEVISGGQIGLQFTNDLFDPATGLDRNLFIDRIVIDGVTHHTEGPSVFHTGLYLNGSFSGPGFFNTETLNTNGTIFFSDDNTPRDPTDERQVTFVARGTTGDEVVSLSINGEVVQSFQLSQINQQYEYRTSGTFTADQVQFSFDNDLFDPATGTDRNVVLEFLETENLATNQLSRFTGDSSNVFSTGTFRNEDGITPGFGRGNTLHANGFFSFEDGTVSPPISGSGSLIRFAAVGTTGEEIAQVFVGDEVVFETVVRSSFFPIEATGRFEYEVVLDRDVDLSDVRIAFVNDGTSATGEDRNLSVDYVFVRDLDTGAVQRTTAADNSTFSTGTYLNGSVEDGFGRGFTLHTNGFFQFTNSSRILVDVEGSTGEERFQVTIDGQFVGEFGVNEATALEFMNSFETAIAVDVPQSVSIEDVRIEFINDGFDANGVDRNLTVRKVRLDGLTYDADSAFSTGTYLAADGVTPGTGRGSILHTNGFLQFGVVPDASEVVLPNIRGGEEVIVTHLEPANADRNPFGPFSTFQEENGDIVVRLLRNSNFGLAAGTLTFQVLPSEFLGGPVPNSVSQTPVTVVFEEGDIAQNLVIPVDNNNDPDSGFFELTVIDTSEGLQSRISPISFQLADSD